MRELSDELSGKLDFRKSKYHILFAMGCLIGVAYVIFIFKLI